MNKRDMILKALVKFEGKWPNDAFTHIMYSPSRGFDLAVSKTGSGSFRDGFGEYFFLSVWKCVSDRAEFEAVLKELRDTAPEGATHFDPKDKKDSKWIMKDGEDYWFITSEGRWSFWHNVSSYDFLIPLPEAEPEKWVPESSSDWTPEFNKKCLCYPRDGGDCFEVTLIAIDGEYWIFRHHKGDLTRHSYFATDKLDTFRPLRTESEIKRERLYDEIYALDVDMDDYQINRVVEFIQGRNND